MASPTASPARTGSAEGEGLRADAPEWAPQARYQHGGEPYSPGAQVPRRENGVKPIRTSSRQRGDVLASLDAIPFTPSQGVCTPSPTNMAAMWVPHPFFQQQQAWTSMAAGFAGSPGPSSGGSDSSMLHSSSQPGTPGGGMPVMWNGFCQPLPYSPTALQIAAASGALGSDPCTPVRGRPGSASAAAAMGGPLFMPGSPVVLSPGQMMFAQYFGTDGAARGSKQRSQSPPESKDSGSGDEGDTSDGMSSSGSGNLEVSEAAHQIASAMCAAQQLPGEPPQQLLELASLLHAYGLVSAVPAFPSAAPFAPSAPSGAPLSPDSRRQQQRQRQKSVPKLNADGSVRLNARQRRTLRRAQERAMKALLEAQTKVHGISSEQAASNLASMGMTSMLLGSPPPAPAPMHSAPMAMPMPAMPAYLPSPGMAMPMSPGPLPAMLAGPDFGMMHGMQQAAAAAAMMQQQAAASAGFDAMYGLPGGPDSLPVPIPMHGGLAAAHSTPPPRYAGSRAGPSYRGTPGSGGYRGTPGGGRMSRFAPPDAVAAF